MRGNQNNSLMKKHFLFFAFAALLSPTLLAQFSLAVQGGVQQSSYINFGKFHNLSSTSPRFQPGYHIGFVPAFKIASGKIEVSAPLSFVERQFKSMPQAPDMPISRDRFRSLELNPRLGVFIVPDFSVLAGIYANYIVQTQSNPAEDGWVIVPKLIREQLYNSFEVGFTGGLRYSISRFHIYGNAQYGLSPLTDVQFTDVNGEPLDNFSGRSLSFQLGLGYSIIGKNRSN